MGIGSVLCPAAATAAAPLLTTVCAMHDMSAHKVGRLLGQTGVGGHLSSESTHSPSAHIDSPAAHALAVQAWFSGWQATSRSEHVCNPPVAPEMRIGPQQRGFEAGQPYRPVGLSSKATCDEKEHSDAEVAQLPSTQL